ncbi:hypothetical protein G6F65_023471 [Rhizopus arrhizus]|nr:hypothetical protein G6F31_021963 [Rhizopus arrhizus]KAG1241409.1 hypothetical protein G6F65_023471 [Rhizopus arrhizus]
MCRRLQHEQQSVRRRHGPGAWSGGLSVPEAALLARSAVAGLCLGPHGRRKLPPRTATVARQHERVH